MAGGGEAAPALGYDRTTVPTASPHPCGRREDGTLIVRRALIFGWIAAGGLLALGVLTITSLGLPLLATALAGSLVLVRKSGSEEAWAALVGAGGVLLALLAPQVVQAVPCGAGGMLQGTASSQCYGPGTRELVLLGLALVGGGVVAGLNRTRRRG